MKKLLLLFFVAILAGCSSTEQYKLYADSHAQMETAKYNAEAAKYKAMSDIANNGTESAKVAAVMAIALGGNVGGNRTNGLQAPQQSEALQWAQILVPSVVQTVGIVANRKIATTQSNNAAAVAQSTNATFLGMAGQIQAPAANVTTTNTDDHTQNLSGTGVLGSGTYSTNELSGTGTTGAGNYTTSTPVFTPTVITPTAVAPIVTPVVVTPVPVTPVP